MKPIQTILHPTDFSENSTNALEVACALARDQDARLIILHVVPHPPAVFWRDETVPHRLGEHFEEDLIAYQSEMENKLQNLHVPDAHVQVEHQLRKGNVPAAIVRAASEAACDFIVMGTRGQSGLGRGLVGSVAEEVIRKAPCPVLTFSAPRPNGQPAENSADEQAVLAGAR